MKKLKTKNAGISRKAILWIASAGLLFFNACNSDSEIERLRAEMMKLDSTRDDSFSSGVETFDYQQLSSVVLAEGHIRNGYDLIQLSTDGELVVFLGPLSSNSPNYKRYSYNVGDELFWDLKSLVELNRAAQLKWVYNSKAKDTDRVVLVLNRNNSQSPKTVNCNGYLPDQVNEIKRFMEKELKALAISEGTEKTISTQEAMKAISQLIE